MLGDAGGATFSYVSWNRSKIARIVMVKRSFEGKVRAETFEDLSPCHAHDSSPLPLCLTRLIDSNKLRKISSHQMIHLDLSSNQPHPLELGHVQAPVQARESA